MAPMSYFLVTLISIWTLLLGANGQLSTTFYATSCPNLESIVRSGMQAAVNAETRMAASILRMHFHDCFVLGCDASVLLDDTATFTGEKTAGPNVNSLRGFEVIDTIKSQVEASCSGVVSCADILTLAARDAVVLVGGRSWPVVLGRRDRRTASLALANSDLPGPGSSLSTLIARFQAKGLTAAEMTALSGAHTIGAARCLTFRSHIYNDTNIDPSFAALRQQNCPFSGGDGNLAQLDVRTPVQFDNQYYVNLVARQGLFHSDQELFGTGSSQNARVTAYGLSNSLFLSDFANAMIKMGNIGVLTGTNGEIRTNCRAIN